MIYPLLDSWQYRIARDLPGGIDLPGGWRLETGPDLPVSEISDQSGQVVGRLLGFGIDLSARCLIDGPWQAPATLGQDIDGFARACQLALGGRFLLIIATEAQLRLYPDCSAQVPLVHDAARSIAGSTATALYDEATYEAAFNRTLYDKLGVDGEGWFPSGLTAHKGLDRVLTNHVLDLNAGTITRTWPSNDLSVTDDPEALIDGYIDLIQAQLEAMAKGPKRVALALTAGLDTRSLLACAKPYLDQIDCLTVVGSDRHATDSIMARKVAGLAGVKHITLPRQESTAEQRALFLRRGGHCNGDSNSRFHPSVWPVKDSHVFVGGLGAELARGFFWRPTDTVDSQFSAEQLLGRMGLPPDPDCMKAVDTLLNSMPGTSGLQKLDLLYAEDRHCAWYAAQFCSDPTLVRQAPMLTTQAVEMMFQLPPEWKRGARLGHAVVARAWPELAELPYNSLGPWRDRYYKLRRALSDPQVVVKKLRKMRA